LWFFHLCTYIIIWTEVITPKICIILLLLLQIFNASTVTLSLQKNGWAIDRHELCTINRSNPYWSQCRLKGMVFWDVMPYTERTQQFRGTYHLHLLGWRASKARNQQKEAEKWAYWWHIASKQQALWLLHRVTTKVTNMTISNPRQCKLYALLHIEKLHYKSAILFFMNMQTDHIRLTGGCVWFK
jgi:hypothetical protein